MKKCKTCKHWQYTGIVGKCSGIFPKAILIPIPNQPKGKPDGKVITKSGIISDATFVMTGADWGCKNWTRK